MSSLKELTFSLLPAYDDAEVEVAHTAKGAEVEHASVSAHLTGMGICPEISHFYELSVLADPSPNHPASLKKGRATASWTTAFPPVSRMHRPPTSIFETWLKVLKAPRGLPLGGPHIPAWTCSKPGLWQLKLQTAVLSGGDWPVFGLASAGLLHCGFGCSF